MEYMESKMQDLYDAEMERSAMTTPTKSDTPRTDAALQAAHDGQNNVILAEVQNATNIARTLERELAEARLRDSDLIVPIEIGDLTIGLEDMEAIQAARGMLRGYPKLGECVTAMLESRNRDLDNLHGGVKRMKAEIESLRVYAQGLKTTLGEVVAAWLATSPTAQGGEDADCARFVAALEAANTVLQSPHSQDAAPKVIKDFPGEAVEAYRVSHGGNLPTLAEAFPDPEAGAVDLRSEAVAVVPKLGDASLVKAAEVILGLWQETELDPEDEDYEAWMAAFNESVTTWLSQARAALVRNVEGEGFKPLPPHMEEASDRCKCGTTPCMLGGASGPFWVNCAACGKSGEGASTKAEAVHLWNAASAERGDANGR